MSLITHAFLCRMFNAFGIVVIISNGEYFKQLNNCSAFVKPFRKWRNNWPHLYHPCICSTNWMTHLIRFYLVVLSYLLTNYIMKFKELNLTHFDCSLFFRQYKMIGSRIPNQTLRKISWTTTKQIECWILKWAPSPKLILILIFPCW